MNRQEGAAILSERLERFRALTYRELLPMLNHPKIVEGMSPSGAAYRMEITVYWQRLPDGNLQVIGILDDFGCQTYVPLVESFVVVKD